VSEFVVITGLSGAGRSQAADHLEDLGWFVIDNLPAELIEKVAELASAPGAPFSKVALVVGPGPAFDDLLPTLRRMASGATPVRILFLDASTDVLVRRYEQTRRRHPLAEGEGLADAIEAERALLDPVKAHADAVLDTSDLNVHQLRDRIVALFAGDEGADDRMRTSVVSFGFKHGLPLDVDMVVDCRWMPNPHWVEELRPLTGLDAPVRDYVLGQPKAGEFLDRLESLFELVLPDFAGEGKSYLTIAIGCTGGQHRSVAVAEALAARLAEHGVTPTVVHRDLRR